MLTELAWGLAFKLGIRTKNPTLGWFEEWLDDIAFSWLEICWLDPSARQCSDSVDLLPEDDLL